MKLLFFIYLITFLEILSGKSIGVFSGYNNHSIINEKKRHESLLENIVQLNYFNVVYFMNSKNSFGIDLSYDGSKEKKISFQHRYSIIDNELIFMGHSISVNENDESNYNLLFGINRNIGNSLILGAISDFPLKDFNSVTLNFFVGSKL